QVAALLVAGAWLIALGGLLTLPARGAGPVGLLALLAAVILVVVLGVPLLVASLGIALLYRRRGWGAALGLMIATTHFALLHLAAGGFILWTLRDEGLPLPWNWDNRWGALCVGAIWLGNLLLLPASLWAIWLLSRPDVRSAFKERRWAGEEG